MNLRTLFLAAPLAVVLACGGSTSTGTGSDALNAATPSFATLSLDQVATDTTPPTAALVADTGSTQMMGPGGFGCHPHLFMREREVVERVNRHIYKVLRKVEKLIASNPQIDTDKSKTWTKTEGGVDFSFTIRLEGVANTYSWELDAGPTGTIPVPVMTGYIDRSQATGEHDGEGLMTVDFALLHAAFPDVKVAQGKIELQFKVSAAARTIAVKATDVAWDLDPGHFDGGVIPSGLNQPRSGEYVYHREPGKGGSLKIQDQMVFLCSMDSKTANPNLVPADARMVSRWYRGTDGTIHGRSDGLITGGQLAASQVGRIVGVTCHDASAEQHMPTEGYWLMKAESATGGTLVGFSSMSLLDTSATPCDPAYGAVPNLIDSQQDFKLWPETFYEIPPAPYPFLPKT
jgi:hypothetical protein